MKLVPLETNNDNYNEDLLDRHPVVYDPNEDVLYMGDIGDHHTEVFEALGRKWGVGSQGLNGSPAAMGGWYPDRNELHWYGRRTPAPTLDKQNEAHGLLADWFGLEHDPWKVGKTSRVWIEHRGVKFKDGSEVQWPQEQGSHVEWMLKNGVKPEQVDDYFRIYNDGDKEYLRNFYGDFWDREYERAEKDSWKLADTLTEPTVSHEWVDTGAPPTEWSQWSSRMPFKVLQHEHDPNDLVVLHAQGGEHADLDWSERARELEGRGYGNRGLWCHQAQQLSRVTRGWITD
jgi:hypothetical protein